MWSERENSEREKKDRVKNADLRSTGEKQTQYEDDVFASKEDREIDEGMEIARM
jgi:hypothetical protein